MGLSMAVELVGDSEEKKETKKGEKTEENLKMEERRRCSSNGGEKGEWLRKWGKVLLCILLGTFSTRSCRKS